jgi:hypothetical protein
VSPLPFPLESRLEFWPAAAEAKLDGMCEGMFDEIQVVGPEGSGYPGGIGNVSRRTGNAKDRFGDAVRANTDVQGVKRGAKNEGVSSCLCETWAREKELRVV